ncbi:TIGR01777 family oxidoreductase [Ancylomarina longa]|uniref:TIGR01777 family protein n=1 Tax=Ancylomarina longa TaxID=2487017 RepID=A0A434AZS7_9BACT|nr:TIGR01777 family oxidoreductase [Ancylomarina longa]RUT80044.1 TIGR01777 family protein [Ancylomarina longa]
MKIGISGSNGFVGSHLRSYLDKILQAEIIAITRKLLYSDPKDLALFLEDCEVIIHLSGAPIVSRWTKKRMKVLRDSRVLTTQTLAKAIILMHKKPKLFISTSAVGIYNSLQLHDDFSKNYGNDFLSQLCQEWENATNPIQAIGVRTVIFRLGLVLSPDGGILRRISPVFKFGMGGKIGNGQQAFPFIHINDLLCAYLHVIQNDRSVGIYNLVAPEIISNIDFTQILKLHFKMPAIFTVPSYLLHLIFLGGADALLNGQKVVSKRLKSEGYKFRNVTINSIYG